MFVGLRSERIDSDFDYLLDPERRRTLLSRWQAAVAGRVIPKSA